MVGYCKEFTKISRDVEDLKKEKLKNDLYSTEFVLSVLNTFSLDKEGFDMRSLNSKMYTLKNNGSLEIIQGKSSEMKRVLNFVNRDGLLKILNYHLEKDLIKEYSGEIDSVISEKKEFYLSRKVDSMF